MDINEIANDTQISSVAIMPHAGERSLWLALEVTDPEVVSALAKIPDGPERNQTALLALRIGMLSLLSASGQLDSATIHRAADNLITEMKELIASRGNELTGTVTSLVKQYFDPQNGIVEQRLQALLERNGELDRLLNSHIGADDSVLAKSLAQHLGKDSPIFEMLSPDSSKGLKSQVERTLVEALSNQRQNILSEFSLDKKDSALSRLVAEVSQNQNKLTESMTGQIDGLVDELSLDKPDSALSRLVERVERAQRSISEEFSSDNERSALSRLSGLLKETSQQIAQNFTLDNQDSALSRLKSELQRSLDAMTTSNTQFQSEVRETLAVLDARKNDLKISTRKGFVFESELGNLLMKQAQKLADVYSAVGSFAGIIKNCKVGDHVVELGPDSRAPGATVVWEAKQNESYTVKQALEELEKAKKNRQAQVGVFVFSKDIAPATIEPFARYGDKILIVWDAEDPATDILVQAAYAVATAIAAAETNHSSELKESHDKINSAVRMVEKQIDYLVNIKTWAETIESNGRKIVEKSDKARAELQLQVALVDQELRALKRSDGADSVTIE